MDTMVVLRCSRALGIGLLGLLACAAGAAGASLTWSGGTGNWNTSAASWNGGTATFTDGGVDSVLFDSSSTGTVTVAAGMTPLSTTISGAGTYLFTGTGTCIDAGTLDKSGSGTTQVQCTNTFTGVTLSGGVLEYDAQGSAQGVTVDRLGSGTITFAGSATLRYKDAGDAQKAATANPIAIGDGLSVVLDYNGPNNQGPGGGFTGVISGGTVTPVNVTIQSSLLNFYAQSLNPGNTFRGTLTLGARTGINYTGDGVFGHPSNTIVSGSLSSFTLNGLTLTRSIQLAGQLVFSGGTFAGTFTGGAGIRTGGGVLVLNNTGTGWTGDVEINSGTLSISSPANLGTQAGAVRLVNAGQVLRITGDGGTFASPLRVESNVSNNFVDVPSASGWVNWTGNLHTSGSGARYLAKTGPGTLSFSNINPGADMLIVTVQQGTLRIDDPTTSGLRDFTVQNGATLSGTGQLALAATRAVTVQNGGRLAGTLNITGGNGVIIQDGATVAPGFSPGTMTVSALTLGSGAVLDYQLYDPAFVGSGVNDLIQVTGGLTLDGTLRLSKIERAGDYTIMTYGSLNADNGLLIDFNGLGMTGSIEVAGGSVILHAIPEPATAWLLLSAALTALRRRRRA